MTTHSRWATTGLPNSQVRLNTSNAVSLLVGFAVLLLTTSAAIAQPRTGTIKQLTLKSTVLGEDRIVLVRTPAGYETNKLRYPVLYMTDGDAHMGHTASTIEFLTRNGRIPDLIVVGVTNYRSYSRPNACKVHSKKSRRRAAISNRRWRRQLSQVLRKRTHP